MAEIISSNDLGENRLSFCWEYKPLTGAGHAFGSYEISLCRLTRIGPVDFGDFKMKYLASPFPNGPGFYEIHFKATGLEDRPIITTYGKYYDAFGCLKDDISSEMIRPLEESAKEIRQLNRLGLLNVKNLPQIIHLQATVAQIFSYFERNICLIPPFVLPHEVVDDNDLISKLSRSQKRKYYKGELQL